MAAVREEKEAEVAEVEEMGVRRDGERERDWRGTERRARRLLDERDEVAD